MVTGLVSALYSPLTKDAFCSLYSTWNPARKLGFNPMRHLIFRKLSASISLKLIQFVFTSPHTQIGMSIVNTCYLLQHWEPKKMHKNPVREALEDLVVT